MPCANPAPILQKPASSSTRPPLSQRSPTTAHRAETASPSNPGPRLHLKKSSAPHRPRSPTRHQLIGFRNPAVKAQNGMSTVGGSRSDPELIDRARMRGCPRAPHQRPRLRGDPRGSRLMATYASTTGTGCVTATIPAVIAYLEAENAYTDAMTAASADMRERLYEQIKARVQEDDLSAPARHDDWWYWSRTARGKPIPDPLPPGRPAARPRRRRRHWQAAAAGAGDVILDENALAARTRIPASRRVLPQPRPATARLRSRP